MTHARAIAVVLVALLAACGGKPEERPAGPRLVIVEEHQHAWPAWIEARERGELTEPAILIHLDAHEDLGEPDLREPLPDPVTAEVARRLAREELEVDDVVAPAVATGLVNDFVWIEPPWLEPRTGSGQLSVAVKGRRMTVSRSRTLLLEDQPPTDGRWCAWRNVRLNWKPRGFDRPQILDIDLDFFACENPHASHTDVEITQSEYDRLRTGARVKLEGEAREGDVLTRSVVLSRPPGPYRWPVRLDRARNLADGTVRYVRGCICMGEYRDAFPVHRPTGEELDALVAEVETTLRSWELSPAIITIARSAQSGFVDPARVDAIQAKVVAMLRRVYPGLTTGE